MISLLSKPYTFHEKIHLGSDSFVRYSFLSRICKRDRTHCTTSDYSYTGSSSVSWHARERLCFSHNSFLRLKCKSSIQPHNSRAVVSRYSRQHIRPTHNLFHRQLISKSIYQQSADNEHYCRHQWNNSGGHIIPNIISVREFHTDCRTNVYNLMGRRYK
jgi:hypothetical protein